MKNVLLLWILLAALGVLPASAQYLYRPTPYTYLFNTNATAAEARAYLGLGAGGGSFTNASILNSIIADSSITGGTNTSSLFLNSTLTGFTSSLQTNTDLTASRVLVSDAAQRITNSTISTTTLGYLDATSSIQTQLNAKGAATNGTFSGGTFTGATNIGGYYTNPVFYGGTNNSTTLAGTTTTGVGFSGAGLFSGAGKFGTMSAVAPSPGNLEVYQDSNGVAVQTWASSSTNYLKLYNKIGGYDTAYLGLNYSTTGGLMLQNTYPAATVTPLSLFSPARAIDTTYNTYFLQKGTYSGLGGVSNAFQIYAGASLAALEFTAAGAAAPITFMTGGTTERMRLSSAGNLGVGTATPQYIGDFNGQVRILGTNGMRFGGSPNATDDTVRISQTSANVLALTATSTTVSGSLTPSGRLILPMGEISYFNTTGTLITIGGTSDGSSNMQVVNPATALSSGVHEFDNGGGNTGRLRYTGTTTRMFHVAVTLSGTPQTGNDVFVFGVAKGGTVIAASKVLGSTSGTQLSALHAMVELASNEYLELFVGNTSATRNFTVKSLNIFALGN